METAATPSRTPFATVLLLSLATAAWPDLLPAQHASDPSALSVALVPAASGGTHGLGLTAAVEAAYGPWVGVIRHVNAKRGSVDENTTRTKTREWAALAGLRFRNEKGLWGFVLGPARSRLEEIRYGGLTGVSTMGILTGGGHPSVESEDVEEGVLGLGFRLFTRSYGNVAWGAAFQGNVNGVRSWVGASLGVWLSTGTGRRDS